jgi:hypothetical protein
MLARFSRLLHAEGARWVGRVHSMLRPGRLLSPGPLEQMSENERADILKTTADAARQLSAPVPSGDRSA